MQSGRGMFGNHHELFSSFRLWHAAPPQVMREIIESIGPIKFMCWEQPYLDVITARRADEVSHLMTYRVYGIFSLSIARCSPVLAACAAFTLMGLRGDPMRPVPCRAVPSMTVPEHFLAFRFLVLPP